MTGAGSALAHGGTTGNCSARPRHWHDVVAILACPAQTRQCPSLELNATAACEKGYVNATAVCEEGYASTLCASCAPSFRRTSAGQCTPCARTQMAAGIGGALLCVVLALATAHAVHRSEALRARLAQFRTHASLVWGLAWQSIRIVISLLQVGAR